MPSTYIVLVNWNGYRDTIECIESLLRLDDGDFAVVVVDNGSQDESVAAITAWAAERSAPLVGPPWQFLPAERRWTPSLRTLAVAESSRSALGDVRITIIDAGVNLGFAGANNVGMRFASRDENARYFWLLNNDTVVAPDALRRLRVQTDRFPEQGIIGSTLLYYDSPDTVQGLGGWIDSRHARAGHIGYGLSANAVPTAVEVDRRLSYVLGASMFVRREVVDRIGGMSEEYFLYFEEADWAKRLPADLRQAVCLEAIVYHKEGGSIGTRSTGRGSDTSLYYFTASMLRYYWKHERRHACLAAGKLLWRGLRHGLTRDFAATRITASAFADVLFGRRRQGVYGSAEFRARG